VSAIFVDALDQDYIFAKMRNPLRTHYEEFANSADLDGIARTVDAKSHWMERSFWVGLLAGLLRNFREFNFVTYTTYCMSFVRVMPIQLERRQVKHFFAKSCSLQQLFMNNKKTPAF
jgi:hypothetical protein